MNTINRRNALPFAAMVALLFLGIAPQTLAQSAQDQLVGTWMLVSVQIEAPDGSKFDAFGANPTGILIMDGSGHISVQFIGSGLPKFASNDRLEGTSEENKAVQHGIFCYFGTYSVSGADHSLNIHIESSSFRIGKRLIEAISDPYRGRNEMDRPYCVNRRSGLKI